MAQEKLRVLFLCTGNSCRSQMAEGWTRHLKGDLIEPCSAGIETHGMNPFAVRVMAESGVDLSGQTSQHFDEFSESDLDVIVTVCSHAHESCPELPASVKVLHVGFDDPPRMAQAFDDEESKLACYRQVRDQIRDFVQTLPQALS